jgi:hypothetical protein
MAEAEEEDEEELQEAVHKAKEMDEDIAAGATEASLRRTVSPHFTGGIFGLLCVGAARPRPVQIRRRRRRTGARSTRRACVARGCRAQSPPLPNQACFACPCAHGAHTRSPGPPTPAEAAGAAAHTRLWTARTPRACRGWWGSRCGDGSTSRVSASRGAEMGAHTSRESRPHSPVTRGGRPFPQYVTHGALPVPPLLRALFRRLRLRVTCPAGPRETQPHRLGGGAGRGGAGRQDAGRSRMKEVYMLCSLYLKITCRYLRSVPAHSGDAIRACE